MISFCPGRTSLDRIWNICCPVLGSLPTVIWASLRSLGSPVVGSMKSAEAFSYAARMVSAVTCSASCSNVTMYTDPPRKSMDTGKPHRNKAMSPGNTIRAEKAKYQ